jgi:CRISPR-associated endonuclease Cas1
MAATHTVAQPFLLRKFVSKTSELKPRRGVVVLSGFGISVRVDRGHLCLEDGIGEDRRECRMSRVDHGLKRLVVIGSDGVVSLAALRWLAERDASFVMLNREGSVLVATGPVRPSDVKMRRAQALALQNGIALKISRELIDRKLAGQERVAKEELRDEPAALAIRQRRSELAEIESVDAARLVEAQAAKIYWSAWRNVDVKFPKPDLARVPEHWLAFGSRMSSLTSSPRRATNPVNAILNLLYALLEAESRLAAASLGLDPGMGVLHVDGQYRDSLACDLMEPVRPDVDAFVLDWLRREPLLRNYFFEQRDGNCRLMSAFASRLLETAPTWARLVAPIAEWFAQEIHKSKLAHRRSNLPPGLKGAYRSEKEAAPLTEGKLAFRRKKACPGCGKDVYSPRTRCNECMKEVHAEQIVEVSRLGRVVTLGPEAQEKRAATQRINTQAVWDWNPSDHPSWLTTDLYSAKIRPRLVSLPCSLLAKRMKVSVSYADQIRKGRVPHPRHWQALAELVGLNRKR